MSLTADRPTQKREGKLFSYPVAAATKIYAGSMVALDSSGNAVAASLATGLIIVGSALEIADNSSGAAADISVKVESGVFGWDKSGTVTKSSIGDVVYAHDDHSIQTSSTSASVAGILVDIDSDGQCHVLMGPPVGLATTGLLAANNLNDVGTVATAAHNLGLGTADSPTFSGETLTGALVGTTAAFTGIVTGLHPHAVKTTTYGVATATDADALLQSLTDGEIFNLPACAAGNKGQKVTFQNTAADGAALIKVEPAGTNKIKGQVGSVEASGASSKGLWNTKATQKQGDHVTLCSDGVDVWWIVGGIGVWASES